MDNNNNNNNNNNNRKKKKKYFIYTAKHRSAELKKKQTEKQLV